MGNAVVVAVQNATRSVLAHDTELATDTILGDLPINRQARDLDHRCHVFIARHLPSAGHLRFISSTLRLSKTLERIGDYAETIARAAVHLSVPPPDSVVRDIEMLGTHGADILKRSLDAFDQSSVVDARATQARVGQYGTTFDKVFGHLVAAGNEKQHPIEDLFSLEAICNRLERILHQGKNICEQTIFAVTGERKGDKTFEILFVDQKGTGSSLLAASFSRRAYPEAGTFKCAGWAKVDEPDPAFVAFAGTLGLDLDGEIPLLSSDVKVRMADFDIVIDLSVGAREHIRKVPFHTTLLRWPLEQTSDPEAVHRQLVNRLGELMDILLGEDDE